MAVVWSKLLQTIPYTCYELGHTWTPSCRLALLEVAYYGFLVSFKIYAPLYLISAILRKKKKEYYLKRLLPEIGQSTLFLGTNAFMFIGSFCAWRRIFDFYFALNVFACAIPSGALAVQIERADRESVPWFNFFTSGFVPAFVAAFVAIIQERKSRRGMLAMYVTNVATETIFRSLMARGLITPIKNGEVLLFCLCAALYMYLFRKRGGLTDATGKAFRFLVGSSESPPAAKRKAAQQVEYGQPSTSTAHTSSSPVGQPRPPSQVGALLRQYCPQQLKDIYLRLVQLPRHRLCGHAHSCVYSLLRRSVGSFAVGFSIHAAIRLIGSLPNMFKKPSALVRAIKDKENVYLGAFLGTYTALFKAVSCAMRWIRDEDSELHGLLAGFVAGTSMMWYKSLTLTMYFAFKLGETMYFKGVEKGVVPYIQFADVIIYAFSTAVIFHTAVFEPQNLRPAYWKFLIRITNGRFGDMNRRLLDFYGTEASKLMPDFWPKYDPRYTSLTPDKVLLPS